MDRAGERFTVLVDKREGEPLGAEVDAAVFDGVQTCDNHCEFCFVHQLPRGMRRSLYLKDDDYRLSFLYGNFTTLTRFTELDYERVVTERLSPLYVSIHATDPDVRAAILQNRRGAVSLRWLRLLLDAGIEVHGQVVVCPGRQRRRRAGRHPRGRARPLRCAADPVHRAAGACRSSTASPGCGSTPGPRPPQSWIWRRAGRQCSCGCWAAGWPSSPTEYYLMCGREFPAAEHYEGFDMHEDGIGMARSFQTEFSEDGHAPTPPRSGFFAWVDGAPADGYRAPRQGSAAEVVAAGPDATPVAVSLTPPAPPPRRARRGVDRHPGRARGGAAGRLAGARRSAGGGGGEPLLRRQHRRDRPDGGRGRGPRARSRARGTPLPAARRVPQPGPLPRRDVHPRPAPAPSRWSLPTGGPCGWLWSRRERGGGRGWAVPTSASRRW